MFHVPRAMALGTWNIFLYIIYFIESIAIYFFFAVSTVWLGFGTSFVPVRYCILKCWNLGTKHVKNVHENPTYVEKFYFLFV